MCIIVHKPKDIILDEIVLKNCFNRNDDGAGIAYVKEGKLVIDKGYHDLDKFLAAVKAVEAEELVIHCRLMSKGEVSDENCHPFRIDSEQVPEMSFAFCHNGTLNWRSTTDKSDSRFFAEDVLQQILDRDPYFFEFPIDRAMMSSYIGTNNKFCLMRYNSALNETNVFFVNKQEGIEWNGCWFSNLSFTEEQGRFVIEHDRTRIVSWTPVLWVEKPVYVPPPMHGTGYYSKDSGDMFQDTNKDDWKYDKKFGWYNNNPSYTGDRSLKDYQKAMGIAGKPEKKNDNDKMDYLSENEKKDARKACSDIIASLYPDIKFTKMGTQEICTWGRAELRGMIPELRDMSNRELMNHILYAELEDAPRE